MNRDKLLGQVKRAVYEIEPEVEANMINSLFRMLTSVSIVFVVLAFFYSSTSFAKILFQEDWELGKIDTSKWRFNPTWKIVPSGNVKGLGNHVLELDGGEAGITLKNDFKDFVYEADFQALGNSKLAGFVFRAQDDSNNFYMHQISADGSPHTPNHMRWHWKVGGNWNVEAIPFMDREKIFPNKWYHVRFILQGFTFRAFAIEKEKYGKAGMIQIGEWTDNKKGGTGYFTIGAIGFRSSGGEKMQFDNIIVGETIQDVYPDLFPAGATNIGSVSGKVTAAASGLPIKGAKVRLEEIKTGIVVDTTLSVDDGSFKLSNVPAGTYLAVTRAEGFITSFFGVQTRDEAKPITVTANTETQNINIALLGKGGISGKVVLDGRLTPIADIQIIVENFETGERIAETNTARDGSYKITDLFPGNYRLSANPNPNTGLLREYYDDQSYLAPSKAKPVLVNPDKDTANINFALSVGGSISGLVEDVDGIPIGNTRLRAIDVLSGTTVAETNSQFDGSYRITGLPTGSFEVLAEPPGETGLAKLYYKDASKEIEATGVKVVAPKSTSDINFKFSKTISDLSFITTWLTLGPLGNGGRAADQAIRNDFFISANGETQIIPAPGDVVEYEGKKLSWTVKEIPPGGNNINEALDPKQDINESTAYFAVYLRFSKAQVVNFIVGSDDSIAMWLNGREIWLNATYRGWGPDQDRLKVNVKEGWNLLLVKVSEQGGGWAFSVQAPAALLLETSTKKQIDKFPTPPPNSVTGFLTKWLALAPLTGVGNDDQTIIETDLLKSSGGEDIVSPVGGDPIAYKGTTLNWEVRDLAVSGDNLSRAYGGDKATTAYLATYVKFPVAAEVDLWLGSDDSISAIFNGRNVWKNPFKRGLNIDQDKIVVPAKEGWNLLMLKVSNTGGGPWAFSARFPFLELEWSLEDKVVLMRKPELADEDIIYLNGDTIHLRLLAERGAKVSVDISAMDNTQKLIELKESPTQPGLYEAALTISSRNTSANGLHQLPFKVVDRAGNEASASLEAVLSNPAGAGTAEAIASATLSLKSGLNLVSLPLKPDFPLTARDFAKRLGASFVVEYDKAANRFSTFVPQIVVSTNQGFEVRGGFGYIVNLQVAVEASFSGTAWRGKLASPPMESSEPMESEPIWAFVVAGIIHPEYGKLSSPGEGEGEVLSLRIKNQRSGVVQITTVAENDEGRFAASFVDLAQNSVVKLGDYIEIAIYDASGRLVSGPIKHRVDRNELRNALSIVSLRLGEIIPDKSALGQNYPNPFNPETWIPFRLSQGSEVRLQIYDATGRLVRSIQVGHLEAGVYENRSKAIYWDGRNDIDERVASGIYYYRLQAGGFSAIRKLAVLK